MVSTTPHTDTTQPTVLADSAPPPAIQLPVLMIAGDPARLNIARDALIELELGWEVVFATSSIEAHDLAAARAVDVIMIDLGNRAWDPVELVESLHSHFPRLPIVAMSSPYGVHVALACMRKGAINHFPRELLDTEPAAVLDTLRETAHLGQMRRHGSTCLQNLFFEFALENDRNLVPAVVQRLCEATVETGLCDRPGAVRVGVALEEALLNAMLHGNLEVSSELRQDDESQFHVEVERRRAMTPYSQRQVKVTARISTREGVFSIEDQGPGFDVSHLPDPTDPENLFRVGGRGVLLMRAFMSEVHYNSIGNAVTLVKRR